MPDPWEHIGSNTFLKYHAIQNYIVFGLIFQRWWITLKLNNSRIQIRIRIFTKIESIRPCHTPNLSTKFHPNPSTTFWDVMLWIVFVPISKWWKITLKIPGSISVSVSSPKSNNWVLATHLTCPPKFVWIHPQLFWDIVLYNRFWPYLSMVKNHLKNHQIRIRIFTKM